jgi:2-polyprenyl-3-methyl-5-hydroxy-6-metoxy-1,4-benzoquinol methylase
MVRNPPTTDDRPLFDLWLSAFWLPAAMVASDLLLFDELAARPAASTDVATRLNIGVRGADIVLRMCCALDLLHLRGGKYHVSDVARQYLLKDSPYNWGGVFAHMREMTPFYSTLREVMAPGAVRDVETAQRHGDRPDGVTQAWEAGDVDRELAPSIAAFMESHSAAAAVGVAVNGDFSDVARLLDVGGGSGCFAIAIAERHSLMRCTVMDLDAMCEVATHAVAKANVAGRVDTRAIDMFREPWPADYDAILLSNVLHDWSDEVAQALVDKAFAALPLGGRIYLHEMLLDDHGIGPRTTAAFSVQMLVGTQGRQYSFPELERMLERSGFSDVQVKNTFGYYSLIDARRG